MQNPGFTRKGLASDAPSCRETRHRFGFVPFLVLIGALAANVLPSTMTLTTVYPAPSGVYRNLITTRDAYFARDSGRVGIGTANPAVGLDVSGKTDALRLPSGTSAQRPASPANGDIRYNSDLSQLETFSSSGNSWTGLGGGGGPWTLNGNNIYPTNLANNVGIGKSNPAATLDVQGAVNVSGGINIMNPWYGINTTFGSSVNNYIMGDTYWNNPYSTNQYGGTTMDYIHSGSDGGAFFGGRTGSIFYPWPPPEMGVYGGLHTWDVIAEGGLYVYCDGNGCPKSSSQGGTSGIMALFQRSGTGWIAGTFTQQSDVREKKNIVPVADALKRISALNGVYFQWKNPQMATSRQMGLIAQDVEKVFPEAVSEGPNGRKAVAYSNLTAALVEAVKELEMQNKGLEAQNDVAGKRIEAMEAKIAGLERRRTP